ncbi:hypothetical protein GHK86_09715 [Acidimicrobiaceae bacterium USS-CC1]|uniref:Uncharacterized protein n=1 Tax=Acidiferrimicrobium australe TaxID=2664430 RepID=A0ABW9QX92_9ACTN|nr:hypothetical protein [Acidiferrimicrobium australe]
MTDAHDTIDEVAPFLATWRAELSGQTSVAAGEVQDHLLDLWSQLPEGDRRAKVEAWLTETLSRHLYPVEELEERLGAL